MQNSCDHVPFRFLPLSPLPPSVRLSQCCEVSCVSGPYYDSGENGYACLDPAFFDAEGMAKYPDYAGTWVSIGNWLCDASNNIASCGYDGGDCCLCSCSGLGCLSSDFDCLDPNTHDELYECKASLPAALPCSSEKVHQVGRSRRLGAGTGSGSGRKLFKRVIQGGVERPGRRGRNHRCRRRHRFYRRRCRHTCRH